jgi:hypothetical protein
MQMRRRPNGPQQFRAAAWNWEGRSEKVKAEISGNPFNGLKLEMVVEVIGFESKSKCSRAF